MHMKHEYLCKLNKPVSVGEREKEKQGVRGSARKRKRAETLWRFLKH